MFDLCFYNSKISYRFANYKIKEKYLNMNNVEKNKYNEFLTLQDTEEN